MRKKIIIPAAIATALLGTYFLIGEQSEPDTAAPSRSDIKQVVHDYSVGKLSAESASITSHELSITSDTKDTITYSLPQNEFFVSIAPYINHTHPCAIHSLTGCQGELSNDEFNVTVTDQNGKLVVEDVLQSFDNGFIDLWLPREQTFTVTIERDGKTSVAEISTFEGDDTCVSTMQLT